MKEWFDLGLKELKPTSKIHTPSKGRAWAEVASILDLPKGVPDEVAKYKSSLFVSFTADPAGSSKISRAVVLINSSEGYQRNMLLAKWVTESKAGTGATKAA